MKRQVTQTRPLVVGSKRDMVITIPYGFGFVLEDCDVVKCLVEARARHNKRKYDR